MTAIVFNAFAGWGRGFGFIEEKVKEDTYRQGKAYYLSALSQAAQAISLGAMVQKVAETIFGTISLRASILCNVAPLLSMPVFILLAGIRESQHPAINRFLNADALRVISFITDNVGHLMQAAMTVSMIALFALGEYVYSTAALLAFTYHILSRNNLIPLSGRLEAETYLPLIAFIGELLDGTLISRAMTAFGQPLAQAPRAAFFMQQQLDWVFKKLLFVKQPLLSECDAPFVKPTLSFEEIEAILNQDTVLEFNPSHFTLDLTTLTDLAQDTAFDKLTTCFNEVNWEDCYTLILNKLKDDERFLDEMKETFPDRFFEEDLVIQLASQKKMSKEVYLANHIRQEFIAFIERLKGAEFAEGDQHDIRAARQHMAKALPLIERLPAGIQKEDILLKLAVEGGHYCAEQMERVSKEVLDSFMSELFKDDPLKSIESKALSAFQQARYRAIASLIHSLNARIYSRLFPASVTDNMHIHREMRNIFSLGFYPISKHERSEISLLDFLLMEILALGFNSSLKADYRASFDNSFKEIGPLHIVNYLQGYLNEHKALSEDQRNALLERLQDQNQWNNFLNLFLVNVGILRKK